MPEQIKKLYQSIARWYHEQNTLTHGNPFTLQEAIKSIKARNNLIASLWCLLSGYVLYTGVSTRPEHPNVFTTAEAFLSLTLLILGFVFFGYHLIIQKRVKKMRREYAEKIARENLTPS